MKKLRPDHKIKLHDYQRFNGDVIKIAAIRKVSAQTVFDDMRTIATVLGLDSKDPDLKQKLLAVIIG